MATKRTTAIVRLTSTPPKTRVTGPIAEQDVLEDRLDFETGRLRQAYGICFLARSALESRTDNADEIIEHATETFRLLTGLLIDIESELDLEQFFGVDPPEEAQS